MLVHDDPKEYDSKIEIDFAPCYDHPDCPSDWGTKVFHSDFEFNLISRKYDIADPNKPLKYHYESILVPLSEDGFSQVFVNVIK